MSSTLNIVLQAIYNVTLPPGAGNSPGGSRFNAAEYPEHGDEVPKCR
jgi:hypothetical protein